MSCCGGEAIDEVEDLSSSFNQSVRMNDSMLLTTMAEGIPETTSSSPSQQPKNWSTVLTTETIIMDDSTGDNTGNFKDVICQLVDRMQDSCREAIQGHTWNDLYVTDWDWTTQEEDDSLDDDWPNHLIENNNSGGHLSKQRVTIGWGPQAPPPSWLTYDDTDDEGSDHQNLIILATLVFYHVSEEPLTEDDFIYSGDEDYDEDDYPKSRIISIVAEYQTLKTNTDTSNEDDDAMISSPMQPITTTLKFADPAPLHTYSTILLQNTFLLWRKPVVAKSLTNPHIILLLNPSLAGQLYVHGRRAPENMPEGSFFGLDWSGVGDIKEVYGMLWQEVVVDASIASLDVNRRLLYRLLDLDEDVVWDEDSPVIDLTTSKSATTESESFESTILCDPRYDFVGIAAKALATSFCTEFGPLAYPIASMDEVERMNYFLPKASPLVIVPASVCNILKRGGFFPWYDMMTWYWKTNSEKVSATPSPSVTAAAQEVSLKVVQMAIVDTKYIADPCCCLEEGTVYVNVNVSEAEDYWKHSMKKAKDDYTSILKDCVSTAA
mmetsp:Transcript_19065/g.28256  ORF Transcript_19065/g.28256 Transcript_19065/m.28256 type:complete len:549 (+) Transcript_19065:105-1751(+)